MPGPESEAQTRKRRVDLRLKAAGWTIVPFRDGLDVTGLWAHAVEEYPTENGPADYALVVDGQILGVVEAKKLTVGAGGVLPQAERYSRGVGDSPFDFRGLRVPFLYSTNGEIIYAHDIRHELNLSRQVAAFHTPAALRELLSRDFESACRTLAATPNTHQRLRPYQVEANTAVEQAIAKRRRQMLVAMATGTGKTFTTVNQVYRLMKSAVARRILFLVDRRALAAQAVRAFASFEPEAAYQGIDMQTLIVLGDSGDVPGAYIAAVSSIVVALISAIVSIWSAIRQNRNEQQWEVLKSTLEEQRTRSSARLDYEYEARKRLYRECEPILFQAGELAENGRARVFSLARSARLGYLDAGNHWLGGTGYYLWSTIYSLFVPMTVFKILQQRLTFVDLSVEQSVRMQYEVLKLLNLSFTEPFEMARRRPQLKYDPYHEDWERLRKSDEAAYWIQGVPFGSLDAAVETMIVTSGKGVTYQSYGQFEQAVETAGSPSHERFAALADLFINFHPARRPVLWRILCQQVVLYEVLGRLQTAGSRAKLGSLDELVRVDETTLTKLDWRREGDGFDDSAIRDPLNVAINYVREKLAERMLTAMSGAQTSSPSRSLPKGDTAI
jgi:hypothetical protein